MIRTGLAVLLACVLLALQVPIASADSSTDLKRDGTRLASGGFNSDDEIFWTVDQKRDGHAVAIHWTASSKDGRYFICWNTKTAAGGAKSCDDSIAEGARVRWRLCTGEYPTRTLLQCTRWLTDYA